MTAVKTGLAALVFASLAAGCLEYSNVGGPFGTGGSEAATPSGVYADKVDLLLDIDNSSSMTDKQEVLSLALANLMFSLINPDCVGPDGVAASVQPVSGLDPCPPGTHRLHQPITDIHVGIVSSSLGGHGSDSCPASNATNDDHGHLLARVQPGDPEMVPTYLAKGFLAWDPSGQDQPPGESNFQVFASRFRSMVLGVGQSGCGYESQLEAWYRFLVDPAPYASLEIQQGLATPVGVDSVLLQQRKDFLRPDSLVAIIMLSDEDDCSTKEYGQFYLSNQLVDPANVGKKFHLPRARSECSKNVDDQCCFPCSQPRGSCPDDPACGTPMSDLEDNDSLRCWDQKRRFGVDFLYPIDRYVAGLTTNLIANRDGEFVENPLFVSRDHSGVVLTRPQNFVVLEGIVGVPWQDLAVNPYSLLSGYKVYPDNTTQWGFVLPDGNGAPPADPLMIASVDPRTGVSPRTGDPLTSPGVYTNPINGGEYDIPLRNDLQYACVFNLLMPRDCSTQPPQSVCDCRADLLGMGPNNPLCEANINDMGNTTLQFRAKAYPSIRELTLVQALGSQGVAASICPAQIADPTRADFAYRPAVRALLDTVQDRLRP